MTPARQRGLAAIVGIGDSDYAALKASAEPDRDAGELARGVLGLALEDCGLRAEDLDGIGVASYPQGLLTTEGVAASVGIDPPYHLPQGSILGAASAVDARLCDTMALVYTTTQRALGVTFGGSGGTRFYESYYYYHPWGFSSQGAHWALMFRRHQLLYGSTEAQLGAVSMAIREHASVNPRAVMRDPFDLEGYLASPYVCRPLRRLDYCMVNDGAIALIFRRADKCGGMAHVPVMVTGHGAADQAGDVAQLRSLVMDLQFPAIRTATGDALAMAGGATAENVDHFQAYDAFSINVPVALEGAGLCRRGEGLEFVQEGRIGPGGELPCNTSGGMLSESYMHGFNHAVEAVRQLRHACGSRQVRDAEMSMYVGLTSGGADCTIYTRGTHA